MSFERKFVPLSVIISLGQPCLVIIRSYSAFAVTVESVDGVALASTHFVLKSMNAMI